MSVVIPIELRHFIDGAWHNSESGETFTSNSPADGAELALVPKGGREDAQAAIVAARTAFSKYSKFSPWQRAEFCNAIADRILVRREELAWCLAREQGKPLYTEAYAEVDGTARLFREAAELCKSLQGEFIPVETAYKRVLTYRQARGVYSVITPWNFPMIIPAEYLAPALATGNTVVWVPAPNTSLCAGKLMECIAEADLPKGVVNLVLGPGDVVGDEIVNNPQIDGIGFTGSSPTGRKIAVRGAGKALLLELGGNGPFLILDDADLEKAAAAAAFGSFFNAGQVCAASGRILVTEKNYPEIAERLCGLAAQIRLGDPLLETTTMGPLNNAQVLSKVENHIEDGRSRGAELLYGGNRRADLGSKLFVEPAVLGRVSPASLLNCEETFGPVVPIVVCKDETEILQLAAHAEQGLSSSVFTRDLAKAFRFGEALQTGMVNVNSPSCYWETHLPFGGAAGKQSGMGRLGGKYALQEMTEIKTITFDIS